jgi:hypothetical protein
MRRALIAVAASVGILGSVARDQHVRSDLERWREIAWPFPRDGWPAGRAFRCTDDGCGGEIELYVRPKIGFCNCDRGVTDDDEVDRVADLDLISQGFAPLESGRTIRIAEMPGRLRPYDLRLGDGLEHSAVGIAVSRRCDLVVAVARSNSTVARIEERALEFLGSREIGRWMLAAMDGR